MSSSRARFAALLALAAALSALTACGALRDEPGWWDALAPDSPCYRVDLLDGLDEAATTEVDDLVACVNHHGHIEPLMPVLADGLHWDTRSGDPAAIEVARVANALPSVDVDPFALAGILADALQAPDRPIDELVDVFLELTWGDRANRVRAGEIALTSAEDLDRGVLAPLGPVVPAVAGALLDDPTGTATWLGGWIASDETKRWIRTVGSWAASEDPALAEPVDRLLPGVGALLQATRDPANDEWSGATGDSLRDLLDVYYLRDETPVFAEIAPDATVLLTDDLLRAALEPAIVALHADGHLQAAPSQVVWMTTVDALGEPRDVGEDSSVEAFVRLLARAHGPVDCLDLPVVGAFHVSDDLAVDVLRVLADLDPDTSLAGLDVVAWITGNVVTDWMLETAVGWGVCEGIDQQTLDDLDAVAVITDPQAYDLYVSFVRVLGLMKDDATEDRLPVLADLVQRLYDAGGYEPLEELIRDVGDEPVLVDVIALVPVLADPAAFGITAGDAPAADLTDAVDLLEWVFATDPAVGVAGWARVRPLASPLLRDDGTWTALHALAGLLADDRTRTSALHELLPPLLALDPELTLLDQVGPLVGEPALQGPVLRLAETPQVTTALLASRPADGQEEVPLAFAGRLLVGGTLDDVLRIVDLLLGG